MRTFSAQDQVYPAATDKPLFFRGPFNVQVATDPTGSILTLEFSDDRGLNWYAAHQAGVPYTFNTRDYKTVDNRSSDVYWRLRCTTYNGTSFIAGMRGTL